MITRIALTTLFIVLSINIYSQSTHWQKYFGRGNDEEGYDICTASDGNIYAGGLTSDPRYGWLLKLNPYGDTIWARRIGPIEFIYAVEPTTDGGCIVAGNTGAVVRVSSIGDTLWTIFFQGVEFTEILTTADGNYLLSGNYYTSNNVSSVLIKIDVSGNINWQKEHSAYVTFYNSSIIKSTDEGFTLVGSTYTPAYNAVIVKVDDNGNYLWQRQFKITNVNTILRSIAVKQGGYIMTGYTNIYNQERIFLIKSNMYGDTSNAIVLASDSVEMHPFILRIDDNKFYLSNDYSAFGGTKIRIRSIDTNYSVNKQLIISPKFSYVSVYKINFYTGNNLKDLLITGITDNSNISNEELYVAKIDSALTPPPPISVNPISSEIPSQFSLSQNYPNPFNPATKIKFSLPFPSEGGVQAVKIVVYDILGREITKLVNEQLQPGVYEVEWDASNYPSGVYLYRMSASDPSSSSGQVFAETRKMILMK